MDIAQLGYSVDSSQMAKATVELDKNTAAAGRTQTATQKLEKESERLALSQKQLVAAQRQLPMQFTDIFTSLAAGQNPLQVALQQGGQLKDVFGGIGPALRASLGYVVGLINPITVLAGGIAALGLAWKQNQDQLDEFNLSLARTSGFVGLTSDDLQKMARDIDRAGNSTIGGASEAVNRFVAGGRIAREQLEQVSRATAEWAAISGDSIDDVAKRYESLAKDPLKALLKLNETEHFLTQVQADRVRVLEDEGREQEAVAEAARIYTDHLNEATRAARDGLGEMSRLWATVKNEVAGTWAEVQTYMGLLDKAAKATVGADMATTAGAFLYNNPFRVAMRKINGAGQDQYGAKAAPQVQWAGIDSAVDSAAYTKEMEARKKAEQEWGQLTLSNLSKAEKLEAEIKKIRDAGVATKKSEADIEAAIANARSRYAESAAKGAKAVDPTEALIRRLKEQIALNQEQLQSEDKLTATERMLVQVRTELDRIGAKGSATNKAVIADLLEQARATDLAAQAAERKRIADEALARQQAIFDQQGSNRDRANEIDLLAMGRGSDAVDQLRRQLDIQREYQDELKRLGDRGVAKDKETWDLMAENARVFRDSQLDQERIFQQKRLELMGDYNLGANKAFEDYLERARDVAGQTNEIFSEGFMVLEDIGVDALSGNLDSWESYLDTLEQMILQFIVRQGLSKWMESLGKIGGSGGSSGGGTDWMGMIGNALGGLFGGGRALGGGVRGDRMYRVGEGNQPELLNLGRGRQYLIPGDAGEVEPEFAGGGGGDTYVYQTINAPVPIDSRTQTQMQQEAAWHMRMATTRNS